MVADGAHVIAQGPHGAQLRPLVHIQGLDQGADGEVPSVQQQGVRVLGLLPVDGGLQPGVAPGLAAVLRILGQEVGVQVMGEQNSGLPPGLRGGKGSRRHGQHQQHRRQQAE